MRQKTAHLYEFGPFILDTAQHLLRRQGEAVPLTPKTFDLLLVLLENRGRMLPKDELMRTLWPNSFVDESNLTQQISMIRRALGETAGDHRYIVTVPGRGYRFAAEVKEGPAEEPQLPKEESAIATAPAPHEAISAAEPTPIRRTGLLLAGLAVLALALLAIGYGSYRTVRTKSGDSTPERTLAILPFQSLRDDPKNEFLGFSLADAVITKLDYVNSITVRPSSAIEKYRNTVIEIPKIASELHVNTLLTSNFLREGEDLRITSQLIDVATQNILWKGTFDVKYERLLTVQDSVAQEIIQGLKLTLSPQETARLKADHPRNPLAYEYYLKGVDLYSRNDYPTAIKMLEQSAQIDPSYALTWAHLGRAHTANASFELGGRTEYGAAEAAYQKALALDPTQIEAKIYMANRFTDTGRVESAVPLLREAQSTNPNHAEVHWELGYAYRFGGMLDESVAECERARQLNPNVKLTTSALNTYLYLGEYDKFVDSLPKTSDSALILFYRGFGMYYKTAGEEAAKYFDAAFTLHPSLLQARLGKALSYGVRHQEAKGLEMLRETEHTVSERGVGDPEALYKVAQAYAVLGDRVAALRVFRRSIENGFFSYPYFASDPLLDSIRSDGEFAKSMALARERHEQFKKKFF
jgi:DNA-binding winged helix-turn-helix (wHTH) protein/TolB-like protein